MARTPLGRQLQSVWSVVHEAVFRKVPVERVLEERAVQTRLALTRRQFLHGAAAVGLGAALGGWMPTGAKARAQTAPRIVVVGAGLAGLTAAYRLKQAGYWAQVYEAADRVGGRCHTRRGHFADGQLAEHGGELIDQGHKAVRHLARELGLGLDNLLHAEANHTEPIYHFDGAPYTYQEATDDVKLIWQKLHKDLTAAGYPTTYNSYTPRGLELDQMSIPDWIEESLPGGMGSRLGKLLDVAYNIEFGAESAEQSALNLIFMLGYSGQGQLRIFGPSNEKYRVRGGNDQITTLMAEALGGQIALDSRLVAIRRHSGGEYTLSFTDGGGGGLRDVVADKVVLTVPFSVMRAAVDFSGAGFGERKEMAIRELGMGTNAKLFAQFTDRHWTGLGGNGETYADTGYQCTWDVSRAQEGDSGLLVQYTGGLTGVALGAATPAQGAATFLGQIEPVLPGLSAKFNGMAAIDNWPGYNWTRGSYSFWKVGQYTRFAGIEGEAEGNCHFAGEHTSYDFQGYLNGAVASGDRAAAAIVEELRERGRR